VTTRTTLAQPAAPCRHGPRTAFCCILLFVRRDRLSCCTVLLSHDTICDRLFVQHGVQIRLPRIVVVLDTFSTLLGYPDIESGGASGDDVLSSRRALLIYIHTPNNEMASPVSRRDAQKSKRHSNLPRESGDRIGGICSGPRSYLCDQV
jgi:hypothetical protein